VQGESRLSGRRSGVDIDTMNADGALAWEGRLPPRRSFDGPVGIRSDNGDFDAELWVLP
jgi:hypothetical protein